jgi:hypothetical protein
MEEMQQNSELSWIEVQFLKKGVEVVVQCRNTMKWTYAFAYYLQRNNATELFEDNQRDLEMAVEQLSELLEKPIEPEKIAELRQQVLDKTVYCASRREVVLEDTAKGLLGKSFIAPMALDGPLSDDLSTRRALELSGGAPQPETYCRLGLISFFLTILETCMYVWFKLNFNSLQAVPNASDETYWLI